MQCLLAVLNSHDERTEIECPRFVEDRFITLCRPRNVPVGPVRQVDRDA